MRDRPSLRRNGGRHYGPSGDQVRPVRRGASVCPLLWSWCAPVSSRPRGEPDEEAGRRVAALGGHEEGLRAQAMTDQRVLVIGAGIAGIQASIDLAQMGFQVYLVERTPSIGGGGGRLGENLPPHNCATSALAPPKIRG